MKKISLVIFIVLSVGLMISCNPAGTIVNSYENDDFIFTKIVMPDDCEVWVAKSKSSKESVTAVNEQHTTAGNKATTYNCVITVDENGNEHISDKRLIK